MKKLIRVFAVFLVLCFLTACTDSINQLISGLESSSASQSSAEPDESSGKTESGESSSPSSNTEPSAVSSEGESSEETPDSPESSESSQPSVSSEVSENSASSQEAVHGGREDSSKEESSESPESSSKPEEFGPIGYEDLMSAVNDLPGLYERKNGEEEEYIEIFYDFGRFYASVSYAMDQSVYSFAALDLQPFDCRGSEMRFTAKEYSMMSQWNQYGSVISVILEPTQNGLKFTAENEGGFFPIGTREFTRSNASGVKAFPYTMDTLISYIYEDLAEAEYSEALYGDWVAYTDGVIINLRLDSQGRIRVLKEDEDDNTPDRYLQGYYAAKENPGSLDFYYLGNILSAGGMPTSGQLSVSLMDEDTFTVLPVMDGFIADEKDVTFHRAPWAP